MGAPIKPPIKPPITGTFDLVDHFGQAVTPASYAGRHMLVFFGFTHCKVVCPRALSRLSRVLDALGDTADAVQPLYITVDPDRDGPERMREFLEAGYPRFTGLTGTREAVEAAKKAFKVFAQRRENPDDPDGYDVPHTAISYLLGPDGGYVAHFLDATPDADLTAALARHLAD